MKRYLLFSRGRFAFLLLMKIIYAGAFVGFSLVLQYNVNLVTAEGTTVSEFLTSIAFSTLYIAFVIFFMMLKDRLTVKYVNDAVLRLRKDLSDKLLRIRYSEFSKNDSSLYLSRIINDMKTVSNGYFASVLALPDEIFTFLFATAVAFYINYAVAIVMLALTLLILLVPLIFNKPLNRANMEVSERLKMYTQELKQTFLGMDVVKNFNAQDEVGELLQEANRRLTKKNTLLETLNSMSMDAGVLIVVLLQMGSIAMSGFMYLQGAILIGSVIAVVQLSSNMYGPLMNSAGKIALITGVKDLNKAVLEILEQEDEKECGAIPETYGISVDNVRFSYGDGQPILNGVSVRFEEGKKYLVVGKSGSGKSTLLKLIGKMCAGYDGSIRMGGVDYEKITEKQLYERVSFAQQSSFVFNRSVRGNIDFKYEGNENALKRAINESELQSFVEENGLDNVIDEEVNRISGGEKQRIGLARALFRDTKVLLLDEVTASLDRDTAHKVEKNILDLRDKTILNVSHKIHEDLIGGYDKILVMENGENVFFDSPFKFRESDLYEKYVNASEQFSA